MLPLVGRIAAGRPIEAVEHNETISLADFVRSKEVFVLEVRGESMQDEAILDGDYVLVEKTKTAHNGDIVVALIDRSDATLKRFFREGENIRLQPSNAAMKPIIVPAASVEIAGAGDWRAAEVLKSSRQLPVPSCQRTSKSAGVATWKARIKPRAFLSRLVAGNWQLSSGGGPAPSECRLSSGSRRAVPRPVRS